MIVYKNNIIDYLNYNNAIYPLWESEDKDKRSKFEILFL